MTKVREFITRWDRPADRTWVERDREASVVGAAPEFRRNCDYDELFFQFAGHTTLETEYGVFEMGPAELLLVPGGIAHRSSGDGDSLRLFARLRYPVETL